jgi:hypothetical protein
MQENSEILLLRASRALIFFLWKQNRQQPLLTAHADIILSPHVNTEFEMCQIDGVLIVSVMEWRFAVKS